MSSKDVVCLDSETSVDYYVTTVNSAETKKTDLSENKNEVVDAPNSPTIVVSVDRAGSVKVRKRKKSKRRKKKSNLALDDLTLNHSEEDTRITSSFDTTQTHHKVPKRSISLNERDLARNSKVDFTKEPISSLLNQSVLNGTTLNHSEPATPQAVAVRRRPRKKSSFRNNRKGFIENNSALGASENLVTAGGVINKKNFNVISHTDCAINTEPEDSKILKQKD
uniref:Uncharacterized protein n=1 Tax=Ciona savignyi TaxID=51511 RepID=H2YI04_CIOSA